MRLTVAAIGRLKAGPERDLAGRYEDRLRRSGAALGFELRPLVEEAESRAGSPLERKRDEAARLAARLPERSAIVCLDETGRHLSSQDFADALAAFRDNGTRDLAFVIGGPDGLDPAFRSAAADVLALGRMTWPHGIARVLLAEQLYRATTILAGHPYHRA